MGLSLSIATIRNDDFPIVGENIRHHVFYKKSVRIQNKNATGVGAQKMSNTIYFMRRPYVSLAVQLKGSLVEGCFFNGDPIRLKLGPFHVLEP